jgi:hypothetical protein
MISFTVTPQERELISQIADRVGQEMKELEYPRVDLLMDLSACHANGNPLDFKVLLSFPMFDFAHDVVGIYNHINRSTGKLERFFVPRCSAKYS